MVFASPTDRSKNNALGVFSTYEGELSSFLTHWFGDFWGVIPNGVGCTLVIFGELYPMGSAAPRSLCSFSNSMTPTSTN
jgi:hypothetical protein